MLTPILLPKVGLPYNIWDILLPKIIHCVSEIQIELGMLYFYLLTLSKEAPRQFYPKSHRLRLQMLPGRHDSLPPRYPRWSLPPATPCIASSHPVPCLVCVTNRMRRK